MTTQLTNEQIDELILGEKDHVFYAEKQIAYRNGRIAELEAQRSEELYVVLDCDGDAHGHARELHRAIDLLNVKRVANTYGPYTLYKVTPCNDDGSVRS